MTTNPIAALDATTARLIAGTNAQLHARPIPTAADFAPLADLKPADRSRNFARTTRRTTRTRKVIR